MEKSNGRKSDFGRQLWHKPLFMTKLFLLFYLGIGFPVQANLVLTNDPDSLQQMTVTGTVTDAASSEALAGVTVIVKGTTLGALTDKDGKFSIPVTQRQVSLQFSFIGYEPHEAQATVGTPVNIALVTAVTEIDEVVVVGYGTQKKESVVGAITQVDNAKLVQSGSPTITNAIAGKLSGVLTIQRSGEPGNNAAEITVRGLSSWNGSNPLVLVDGVERDFSQLDPNEINTISVLKDASATAVFGAKGANGVIVVTTKRGNLGKPKLDFSFSYGLEKATRIPDHIDSYTTMNMYNVALMNDGKFSDLISQNVLQEYKNPSTPLNALRYPNVNWFEVCTKPYAPNAVANLNVSGGTEFAKYFLNLGYNYEGTFFTGVKQDYLDARFWNKLFQYRINLDFAVTKSTTISLNVGGSLNLRNTPTSVSWRNLYSTSGARFPAYFPSWVLEMVPDIDYPDQKDWRRSRAFGEYTGNPYTSMTNGDFNRDLGSQLFTDLLFSQKLDKFIKGLSFNGKASLSSYYNNRQLTANYDYPDYELRYDLIPTAGQIDPGTGRRINPWLRANEGNEYYKFPPYDINVGGLNNSPTYYRNLYYELSMNYANSFGRHTVSGLALFNRHQQNRGTDFPYYNEAWVGRATYDYSRKYLVEFNVGYTGSERFAPSRRFGLFPSAAVGWVISEENFFRTAVPWMNKLKLRYSDGYVGSDYATNRWLYTSSYFKDARGYIREDLGANLIAQWERAHKRDIGIEMGFFSNLLTLNVDLFDEYRDRMLLQPKSVTMMVGNSFKERNLGKVKKHGIEFEAEFRHSPTGNLTYFVRGLFGFNENRVIYKDDEPYAPEHRKFAGKPLTTMMFSEAGVEGVEINGVELTGSGYYTSVDDIHNNVSPIDVTKLRVGDYKFLDYDADGNITAAGDKYPIRGLTYPPITYSVSGGFIWRGFEFNILFTGNKGKYVQYNQLYEVEFIKGDWRVHSSQLDYWTPANQDANHSTLHYPGSSSADILFWGGGEADRGYQIMIENRFFRRADYLRLKDVYLGYTFNPAFLQRTLGISSVKLYLSGSNLFTITPLIEGDPESTNFQQGYYPQIASGRLGVRVIF